MLTEQAQSAMNVLYGRISRASESFELERLERALDEIIRLNANRPAPFQIRSAYAHAGELMRHRRDLAPTVSHSEVHHEPGTPDHGFALIDMQLWLDKTPSLTCSQRTLLQGLGAGQDASELAPVHGLNVKRMREHISRVRRCARGAYVSEVRAA
ncbi:hypothetical protein ACFXKD_00355 [Nocardiopsis aegyptia]|uniref:hypothetical protein n=1 Tax=Nocardiopsis aegyptia TaxID=220378 RepID=UPI00366D98F0